MSSPVSGAQMVALIKKVDRIQLFGLSLGYLDTKFQPSLSNGSRVMMDYVDAIRSKIDRPDIKNLILKSIFSMKNWSFVEVL